MRTYGSYNSPLYRLSIIGVSLLLILVPGIPQSGIANAQITQSGWRDTAITIPSSPFKNRNVCFDATQPNVVLITDEHKSTTSYNWVTGEKTSLSSLPYRFCGGIGFSFDGSSKPTAGFFCQADPVGCAEQSAPSSGSSKRAISDVYPRVVYTVSVDNCVDGQIGTGFTVYFSADGGATQEQRYIGGAQCIGTPGGSLPPFVDLWALPNAPVNVVLLTVTDCSCHSDNYLKYFVSGDGARTFQRIGERGLSTSIQVVHTHEGLLRLNRSSVVQDRPRLSLSTDGGIDWTDLPGPHLYAPIGAEALGVQRGAANNVFLQFEQLWHSPDGGHTWRSYEANNDGRFNLQVSPYLPTTVLSVKDNHLYALDLPDAGKYLSRPVVPNNAPGGIYFPQTGHNLYGAFKGYWDAHGGLPQQGYPLTEMVQEVNDTDRKVYTTQYFERAVFELHPENQPPNNVLLSLLGVFEYGRKYPGASGAPGQVSNTSPGSVLFPETGKRLGGKFLGYWQAHGGLRQQGYPISDEFEEKSELDGKTYTVQYFERAVFELHPENAGTPYEVLLSQLGTFRLKGKYGADIAPEGR